MNVILLVLVLLLVWSAAVMALLPPFFSLDRNEVPGALLAWLAGGDARRRLRKIIERRRAAARERLSPPAAEFETRMAKVRPATAAVVLKAWQAGQYPEKQLVTAAEPACDDPDCAGCQALRARRRHEAVR